MYHTVQVGESTEVRDQAENVIGWAYPSDGYAEPYATPMAAKVEGDELKYTQHDSITAALDHIRS